MSVLGVMGWRAAAATDRQAATGSHSTQMSDVSGNLTLALGVMGEILLTVHPFTPSRWGLVQQARFPGRSLVALGAGELDSELSTLWRQCRAWLQI